MIVEDLTLSASFLACAHNTTVKYLVRPGGLDRPNQ